MLKVNNLKLPRVEEAKGKFLVIRSGRKKGQ